jgi:acetyltransferase-like isoleucine patch superfamily enzyme
VGARYLFSNTNLTLTRKNSLSKGQRLLRLISSTLDIRAYIHLLRLVNYFNYTHAIPRRKLFVGKNVSISPTASFSYPERIEIAENVEIGPFCTLWAGPSTGRIVLQKNCLLGPNVLITVANYRFNDGSPVTNQLMDEQDVILGVDVWIGAGSIILPGVSIGDGTIIGAGSVVTRSLEKGVVAAGCPAKPVGTRPNYIEESRLDSIDF